MSSGKGKFINAFQSIQMLGDYDQFDGNNEVITKDEVSLAMNDDSSQNSAPPVIQENGDDLYNPLEDMDVVSDVEDNLNFPKTSEIKKEENTIHPLNTELLEESAGNKLIINDNMSLPTDIFSDMDENTLDASDNNFHEEPDNIEQEQRIIDELEESVKTNELSRSKIDFIDDGDELLGTALAELEQEERERQQELEKIMLLENAGSETSDKKTKKKKKKEIRKDKSSRSDEKESKKKRSKKRKKRKVKEKIAEEAKKKKKSKEKKEIKEKKEHKEKKEKEKISEKIADSKDEQTISCDIKHEPKKGKSTNSSRSELDDIIRTVSKERKQEHPKRKSLDKNKGKKSLDRSRDRKRSSSGGRKSHDRSRDKKRTTSGDRKSHDRSRDKKRSSSGDRKSHDRSRDKKRSSSGDRKRRDSQSINDQHSRKRLSKDTINGDNTYKRSRTEDSEEKHKSKTFKTDGIRELKPLHHRHSSEENDRKQKQRSNSDSRRSSHDKTKTISPGRNRVVDYEVKLPKHEKHSKQEVSPPKLSKEEFYQLQLKARNISEKHDNVEEVSLVRNRKISSSSSTSSSEADVEVEKALHRSSFNEIYEKELSKFRHEHKVDFHKAGHSHNISNNIDHKDTVKCRENSESRSLSYRKSITPPKELHQHDLLAHSDRERKRSFSEFKIEVIQKISPQKKPQYLSDDDASVKMINEDIHSSESESVEISKYHTSIFDEKLEQKNVNHKSLELLSSHSENEESVEPKKSLKPGSLSLHQYKERRNSDKRPHTKHNSSEKKKDSLVVDEKIILSTPESSDAVVEHGGSSSFDRENKENVPRDNLGDENGHISRFDTSEKKRRHGIHEVSGDEFDVGKRNESIPLLFDGEIKSNVHESSQSLGSDIDYDDITTKPESPYNPEAASPLDMASPSVAAIEDRDNVDFNAYKDVVAFEDIMKSKVKHEARKHKRRKLEDLKTDFGSSPPSKDGKLVDYLVRQSQVEENMKGVLKQYYKSREITKEEYKNILKKAVPQVTMSNSPIIPEKIESLMVKFVRKCKGNRAKEEKHRRKQQKELHEQQKQLQLQLKTSAAMFQQIRVLNPDLPMPPL